MLIRNCKKTVIECGVYTGLVALFGWELGLFAFFFLGLLFKIEKARLLSIGISMTVFEVFGLYRGFLILIVPCLTLFLVMWGMQRIASFTAQARESLCNSHISINGGELSVEDKAKIPTRLLIMAIAYLGECLSLLFGVYFLIVKQYKSGFVSVLLLVLFALLVSKAKKSFRWTSIPKI